MFPSTLQTTRIKQSKEVPTNKTKKRELLSKALEWTVIQEDDKFSTLTLPQVHQLI